MLTRHIEMIASTLDENWAKIAVAGVSLLAALVTLHINKRNKISEFRQAWIDELRSELADFMSSARTIASLLEGSNRTEADIKRSTLAMQNANTRITLLTAKSTYDPETFKIRSNIALHQKNVERNRSFVDEMTKALDAPQLVLRNSYSRVRLRLNLGGRSGKGREKKHHYVALRMSRLIAYLDQRGDSINYEYVLLRLERLSMASQDVLKEEWNRVKSGETLFKLRYRVIAPATRHLFTLRRK